MHKTKIVIPFEVLPDNDVPIIKFYLDETPRYAVVDTGAESTLFDKSISNLLHVIKKEKISIVGVSGETEQSMVEVVETKMWMHNDEKQIGILRVQGYVGDLEHISEHFLSDQDNKKISAILGSDMLNYFHADLDFVKHKVVFNL